MLNSSSPRAPWPRGCLFPEDSITGPQLTYIASSELNKVYPDPLRQSPIRTRQFSRRRAQILRTHLRFTMARETELSANERAFILEALHKNVRLDGRAFDQLRPLNLSFGDEYGHVKVQLGRTRCVLHGLSIDRVLLFLNVLYVPCTDYFSVIVRISAEVTAPRPERDSDGIFTVNIELNDMAFAGFETGR